MTSWIRLDRATMDHPFFKREPYTEREAWIWIISEAAWKPRRIAVKGKVVQIGRGELVVSLRDLAKKWRWKSVNRVRGFLDRAVAEQMLSRSQKWAHLGTHLTVCNYEKFQTPGYTERQPEGTAGAQQGHADADNPYENKEKFGPLQGIQGIQKNDSIPPGDPSRTLESILYNECLQYLMAAGKDGEKARTEIGHWRRVVGDDGYLLEMFREAQSCDARNPAGFIQAKIKKQFGTAEDEKVVELHPLAGQGAI